MSGTGFRQRRPRWDHVGAAVVAVALLAVAALGSRPLWATGEAATDDEVRRPARPATVMRSARPAVAPAPERVPQVPLVAAAASRFLEHAVRLPGDRRTGWVAAYSEASSAAGVAAFLSTWVAQINGPDEDWEHVRPVAEVRTLGFRTVAVTPDPAGGERTSVLLWQQISRPGDAELVLTRVTLRRSGGDVLVLSIDGVAPGPDRGPVSEIWYPELRS